MIKIKDTEIEFKITARVELMYENMIFELKKNRELELSPLTSTLIYIYCICAAIYPEANISLDDVIDAYDEQPQMVVELNDTLNARREAQDALLAKYEESNSKKKPNKR